MEFLKLLSRGVQSVVTLPFKLLRWVLRVQRYRSYSEYALTEAGGEVKELSPLKKLLRTVGLILLYVLVVAAVVAAVYGLWYLNRHLDLERQLGGPVPWLRSYWLPLLFVLLVIAGLVGLWLWRLLSPLGEPTDFPDIHEAWVEARAAIEGAGIPVTDVPVFLVLGRPAAGFASLFGASRLTFQVRGVPGRGDAPIQVYANTQGIFVAAPGASLLGRLATLLADEGVNIPPPSSEAAVAPRTVFDDAPDPAPTGAVAAVAVAEPLLLSDEPIGLTVAAAATGPRRTPQLLTNTEEVTRAKARLRYLGRLIAHNRQPFCGVNGIVLLVPFAAGAGDAEAHQAAGACRLDLAAAREGLRTDCPVVALVCDAETAPGAQAFLKLVPDDRKDRLLGQPFPLAPDLPPEKVGGAIGDGLRWAGGALERLIVRGLKVGGDGSVEEAVRTNADLYRFLAAVRTREPRLAHVFGRAAVADDGRVARFAGGFLAATGPDPTRDQAFVPGVFRLLADHQNAVTWTPAAKSEDSAFQTWTMIGYLGIGAFILGVGWVCYREFWW